MLRFVICGIGGFWLMLLSTLSCYGFLMGERVDFLHPLLALPLAILSSLMLLYGIGQWRKWAYLWVFHAPLPTALLFEFLTGEHGKEAILAPIIVSPLVAYFAVQAYYAPSVEAVDNQQQ